MAPKPSIEQRLAKRLRALRAEMGLSQMDLVRDHGWNLSHYQKLERGVIDPKLTTLVRLAKDFGVTLAEMLKDF
ncbi:MAG: helix-turn-helix transcriptional regulator [Deltaproteobacteria bacterium]|nr:helix-turn-helix transcriptional regulator [Deltaproteobacteria bacterium]